jgi:hypothetical protein
MQSGHGIVEAGWGVVRCTQDGEHEIGPMQQGRLVVFHADLSTVPPVVAQPVTAGDIQHVSTRRCAAEGGSERDGPLGRRLTIEESNMPNALAAKSCTPCRGGIPPLTIEEAERYLVQAPDWEAFGWGYATISLQTK